MITLLVTYFRLKHIYFSPYRDTIQPQSLEKIYSQIQRAYQIWLLFIHTLSFISVGASISCFRSLLYISPHKLPLELPFQVFPTPSFPSTST